MHQMGAPLERSMQIFSSPSLPLKETVPLKWPNVRNCPSFVQAQQQIFDKTLCFWTFFCSGDHSPKSDDVQDAREWVTGLYAKCCTLLEVPDMNFSV